MGSRRDSSVEPVNGSSSSSIDEMAVDRNSSTFGLLLQAIAGIGITAWMAHRVDVGLIRSWTVWAQGAWYVGILCASGVGARAIIALSGGDTRFAWTPLLITVWLALAVATGWLLELLFGLPLLSGILGAFALFQAWWTWRLPWWFWEGARAQSLRGVLGDTATRIICALAAVALAVAAIAVAVA